MRFFLLKVLFFPSNIQSEEAEEAGATTPDSARASSGHAKGQLGRSSIPGTNEKWKTNLSAYFEAAISLFTA